MLGWAMASVQNGDLKLKNNWHVAYTLFSTYFPNDWSWLFRINSHPETKSIHYSQRQQQNNIAMAGSAIFKTVGYNTSFWLKIGQFPNLRNSPKPSTKLPKVVGNPFGTTWSRLRKFAAISGGTDPNPILIWAFGACREMIGIEERTPTVAGDLGIFQSNRRSLLECSALPGKDQKLSLRRKSVFHTGNEHWQLQSY